MADITAQGFALAALCVTAALYLPGILRFLRAYLLLLRLPSPRASSLIKGHVHDPQKKHLYENEWTKQLGPVYRIRLYWKQWVVVADPALQKQLFDLERAGAVEKPGLPRLWKSVKGKPEHSVVSELTTHPMWRIVRKGTLPAFQPKVMREHHKEIVAIVGRLISGIRQKGPGALIDIADIAQRESFDVIGKVGYGKDFQASRDIDNSVNNVFRWISNDLAELIKRFSNPLAIYRMGKASEAAEQNHQRVTDILTGLLDETSARRDQLGDSIAGHLLSLKDPEGKPLSRQRLIEEYRIFFVAGSETTGHTIAWTLYFLCKNPAAMDRLAAELEQAGLLRSDANPKPREFTFSDIGRLKWLDACIKESMRLQPVTASPLQRKAVRDIRLADGTLIPAGAGIELASYSIARSPAWGWEDGESYRPERWEDPDAEYYVHSGVGADKGASQTSTHPSGEDLEINAGSVSSTKARRFRPFGAGVRNCLGQQLAHVNIPTAIAMLVSSFKMQLSEEDAKAEINDLGVSKGTLQPKHGIHMYCTPR